MFFFCECCLLSGRGLCDGLIIRPEESYRVWCVVVRDLETLKIKRAWHAGGRSATGRQLKFYVLSYIEYIYIYIYIFVTRI